MRLAHLPSTLLLAAMITAPRVPAQQPTAPPAASARALPSDDEILSIIRQRVQEKRSAGIVVGVIDPDGRQRIVSYGDAGPGQPPLDANTVFEIGSISKVFTATVLAQMVQEGKIRLDDPAQKYLPSGVRLPTRGDKVITVGSLSEQNSGLPRMPANFHPANPQNPYADYSVQQMYEFLSGYSLARDPGAQFEYSNLGVGLLGHILSRVSGQSYEEMERSRVWAPLGMTHTGIAMTDSMKAHLALGHDEQGNVVSNWDLPTLAGAGAIRSTMSDMLRFLDANLHPERGPLQQAMAFAHKERAPAGNMGIGLNWLSLHAGADTIVWHNGGTGGYRSFIGFVPSRKAGVVILTNSTGAGADDIGFHLLNSSLPLAPAPKPPTERKAIVLPQDVLGRYVGTYQLASGLRLDVALVDSALYIHPAQQATLRLWPSSEVDFFVKELDAQFTFVRDTKGFVTGLVLHQGGEDAPAPKVVP